ncbi:MAG TPA: glycosyltransferase [Candidatus Gastranaerophilaceae bacterium]|nr:glycosyltransferase [Candidatus Gastranaerophilaceae bacterium]
MFNLNFKISIITASYNYENFIKETVESVIAQTYSEWELIIVDDGSTDNSVDVIKDYCKKDDRIKFFQHENGINKGLKETLLLGIEKASGKWIAFLESDDIFEPTYLEEKIKAINLTKDVGLVFNDVKMFGDKEQIETYGDYLNRREKMLSSDRLKYTDIFKDNPIQTFSCVIVKKELLTNCNFNSPVSQNLDWLLWAQVINKTKFVYIQKPLTRWRIHSRSYIKSTNRENRGEWLAKLLMALDEKKHCPLWYKFFELINKLSVEKLLRPQVNFISNLIVNLFLGKKSAELVKF